MRTLLIATAAALVLSTVANAETLVQEKQHFDDPLMLSLERAVVIDGTPCLMTTPYDHHARCDTTRVNLRCRNPAFVGNNFVCNGGPDGTGISNKPVPSPPPSSPGERP